MKEKYLLLERLLKLIFMLKLQCGESTKILKEGMKSIFSNIKQNGMERFKNQRCFYREFAKNTIWSRDQIWDRAYDGCCAQLKGTIQISSNRIERNKKSTPRII